VQRARHELAVKKRDGWYKATQSSQFDLLMTRGLEWLAGNMNPDSGWGDTVLSVSNLSTTALGWAAFGAVAGADEKYRNILARVARWLTDHAGGLEPEKLAPAIIQRYGKDRTFSAPILTMCALAGRLGHDRSAWRWIISLPFELAACPHKWFAWLRLPVVSYALPALIAIGQARHYYQPARNPILRLLRDLTRRRTLAVLASIQPQSGGFLEAVPLTSFVVMSLAGSGEVNHPVTANGVAFLMASARSDGSWPIDTNLATWLTTLSVNALGPDACRSLTVADRSHIRSWLLNQQYRAEHPYTHAAPGGWAWTDLPGGVPDADDTAGALLALGCLKESQHPVLSEDENDGVGVARASTAGIGFAPNCQALCFQGEDDAVRKAVADGVRWLLDLQNRDGGIPTFCRGWGALPFDRSSPDLTAHALRAWMAWRCHLPSDMQRRLERAMPKALAYLAHTQRDEGEWIPLWFGNQHAPGDENPTYGTARVLMALTQSLIFISENPTAMILLEAETRRRLIKGAQWLIASQKPDGSWGGFAGGPASIEETALALEALAGILDLPDLSAQSSLGPLHKAVLAGATWLMQQVETGRWTQPSPIGFYFAKLWYYERLYPLIFTAGALARVSRVLPSLSP
jgi:squalene-hopene/tetraprenyl-beta-curcumene cyclase